MAVTAEGGANATDARIAIRNAGLLMAQRGSHLITGVLFAIAVPRIIGPETFGQYALITSVALWFGLLSGVSSVQTMSRFVPQFTARNDAEGLRRFLSSLLALRLTNGVLVASLYFLLTRSLFPELQLSAVAVAAGAIVFRSGAKLLFALFLGLNQAARWGVGDTVSAWVSLMLVVPGAYVGGLPGACLAMLLTELTIFLLGISWARPYLSWSRLRLDRRYVAPYLRFGLAFYGSNVLWSLSQQGGEMLVRLVSGDYVEVGYFGVAYRIHLMSEATLWQLTLSFCPFLMTLQTRGANEELSYWAGRLLKALALSGMLVVFAVVFLGDDLVPLAMGQDFRPVAVNLLVLTLGLLTHGLSCMGRALALIYNRPGVAAQAAVLHLLGFVCLGVPLIAWGGSLAACLAVLAASALHAGYFTWRMRPVVRYSLWQWMLPILLGALFVPLAGLRSSLPFNLGLWVVCVVGYGSVLLLLRVVTSHEIAGMWRAVGPSASRHGTRVSPAGPISG